MGEVFRGIKVRDWVLAAALTALGVVLMQGDISVTDAEVARNIANGSMVHAISTHSAWMLPVFLGATVPVLWWRRSVIAVTGTAIAVIAMHDALFGWVTRCGAGLPVAFVLAFLGAVAYERSKAWLAGGLAALLILVVLAVDATAGMDALVI